MPSQRGRLVEGRVRLPGAKIALSAQANGSTSKAIAPIVAGGRLSRHSTAPAASSATSGNPIHVEFQPSEAAVR